MTGNNQYSGSDPSAQLVSGVYDHSGAAGSTSGRTPPPDDYGVPGDLSGIPNTGVQMALSDQAGHGEGLSSSQPGQTGTSPISPGPEQGYQSTGAGQGSAVIDSSGRRYSWQAKAQAW